MAPSRVTANPKEATKFLRRLFELALRGQFIEFRLIPKGRGRVQSQFLQVQTLFSLPDVTPFLPNPSLNDDYNIYVSAAPRIRKSGRSEDVEEVTAAWVDLDKGWPSPWPPEVPPPSLTVNTSPGKFQCYWLYDTPTSNTAEAREVSRRLAGLLGGDAVFDVARIMRLPGYTNIKYDSAPIVSFSEQSEALTYSIGQMLVVLPEPEIPGIAAGVTQSDGAAPDGSKRTPDSAIVAAFRKNYDDGERRTGTGLPRLVAFLRARHVSEERTVSFLQQWADTHFINWDASLWQSYEQQQIRPVYRRYAEGSEWWTEQRTERWLAWLSWHIANPQAPVQSFLAEGKREELLRRPDEPARSSSPVGKEDTPKGGNSWAILRAVTEGGGPPLPDSIAAVVRTVKQSRSKASFKTPVREMMGQVTDPTPEWSKTQEIFDLCGTMYRRRQCAEVTINHPGRQPAHPYRCHFFLCLSCSISEAIMNRKRNEPRLLKAFTSPATATLITDTLREDQTLDARDCLNKYVSRSTGQGKATGYSIRGVRYNQLWCDQAGGSHLASNIAMDAPLKGLTVKQRLEKERQMDKEGISELSAYDPYADNSEIPAPQPRYKLPLEARPVTPAERKEALEAFFGGWPAYCEAELGVKGYVLYPADRTPQDAVDWFYAMSDYPILADHPGWAPTKEEAALAYELFKGRQHKFQTFGDIETIGAKPPPTIPKCDLCGSMMVTDVIGDIPLSDVKFDEQGRAYWEDPSTALPEGEALPSEAKKAIAGRVAQNRKVWLEAQTNLEIETELLRRRLNKKARTQRARIKKLRRQTQASSRKQNRG